LLGNDASSKRLRFGVSNYILIIRSIRSKRLIYFYISGNIIRLSNYTSYWKGYRISLFVCTVRIYISNLITLFSHCVWWWCIGYSLCHVFVLFINYASFKSINIVHSDLMYYCSLQTIIADYDRLFKNDDLIKECDLLKNEKVMTSINKRVSY
jgi:hypothetical protein